MKKRATFIRTEGNYQVFKFAMFTYYRWEEADGAHWSECHNRDSPPPPEPFGHTLCSTWRTLPDGAAYKTEFESTWQKESRTLDEKVFELVKTLHSAASADVKQLH